MALAQSPTANAVDFVGIIGQLVDKLPPENAALITISAMNASEQTAIEMTQEADGNV